MTDIGSVYKEVRRRRGLAIKQVKAELHSSAVSHFERDDQDIKLTNLLSLLRPTLMAPGEFAQLIAANNHDVHALSTQLALAYDRRDQQALDELYQMYQAAGVTDMPRYLCVLMIRGCRDEVAGRDVALSATECELVEAYLMQDGRWFGLEYIAFSNLAYLLPTKTDLRLLKKMCHEYDHFHLPEYTDYFVGGIYNLSVTFLEKRQFDETKQLINLIVTRKLPVNTLYFKHHIAFLRLVLEKLQGESNDHDIAVFLAATKMIDPELYAKNIDWLKMLGCIESEDKVER